MVCRFLGIFVCRFVLLVIGFGVYFVMRLNDVWM